MGQQQPFQTQHHQRIQDLSNQQLPVSYLQQQQQPIEQVQSQIIQVGNNVQTNDYLKDQPFLVQKRIAIIVILLYFFQNMLSNALALFALHYFDKENIFKHDYYYAGFILLLAITIASRYPMYQEGPISHAIYIIRILIEVQYLAFASIHIQSIYKNDSNIFIQSYFNFFVELSIQSGKKKGLSYFVLLYVFIIQFFLFATILYTFIILVYQGQGLFAFIMIISGPNRAFYRCLSLFQASTIIQSFLIMNGLHQIFQGRFCLKKNQIFGIYNAHFFAIMFPCNF